MPPRTDSEAERNLSACMCVCVCVRASQVSYRSQASLTQCLLLLRGQVARGPCKHSCEVESPFKSKGTSFQSALLLLFKLFCWFLKELWTKVQTLFSLALAMKKYNAIRQKQLKTEDQRSRGLKYFHACLRLQLLF